MSNFTALDTYLKPLEKVFAEDGVNEISINRPFEAWVENKGDIRYEGLPELTLDHLRELALLVAQSTDQRISEENPLLSATLPQGYRIQIVIPPACEPGTIGMSIRKPSSLSLDLDGYEKMGAFDNTAVEEVVDPNDAVLRGFLKEKKTRNHSPPPPPPVEEKKEEVPQEEKKEETKEGRKQGKKVVRSTNKETKYGTKERR